VVCGIIKKKKAKMDIIIKTGFFLAVLLLTWVMFGGKEPPRSC
jgi:hypothetical protein